MTKSTVFMQEVLDIDDINRKATVKSQTGTVYQVSYPRSLDPWKFKKRLFNKEDVDAEVERTLNRNQKPVYQIIQFMTPSKEEFNSITEARREEEAFADY
ncbi:MAG TPA: hypothetical protein DDY49_08910 [Paenibacillaceae bacterium]|nr:hypothetical protein [Paenibacillaceae bacterium]